jgi:2-(1,2-epoxy-1,2-dihydrophenyl)acetyl-CoA isomerase
LQSDVLGELGYVEIQARVEDNRTAIETETRKKKMAEANILNFEKKDGVATITLNRPEKLNAFNDELTFAIQDALKESEKDPSIRCLIITGAGRGFCSGQDLQARTFSDSQPAEKLSLGDSIRRRYNPIITKIRRIEKPVIAAVNGVAAGAGASLALACDLRIAAESAVFIQSFSKIGLVPDSGSTFLLPRIIGVTRALELMLTAEKMDSEEALRLGLVNKVVKQESLMKEAETLAIRLANGPTKAFGLTKRAVNKAIFPDLEELLEYEACVQEIAGRTQDFVEGVKAFTEKRQPAYSGK